MYINGLNWRNLVVMKVLSEVLLFLILLHVTTARSLPPGRLVEFEYSQQEALGRYESGDGISGISFLSQTDHYLLISTFDGKTLIDTEVDVQRKVRSIHMLDHKYLQHSSRTRPDESVGHDQPFSHSIEKLLAVEEVALLPEAAETIGQRGLTGRNTPAMLPFFMFALRVTQLHLSPSVNTTTAIE